jgi:two-component system LytT family response regulator
MIRTLIVEDVPLARAALRRLLSMHDDIVVVGEATTVAGGLEQTRALRPDLAFLDVELPDGTGLMLAEQLDEPRPALIFLTAFAEHALPAFGVEALDYLLKPASSTEVARALDRVRRMLCRNAKALPRPTHLEVRDGNRTHFVALETIDRVDAAGHYLCVHAAGTVHLLRIPIAELIDRLGPAFVRVHRSAVVRVDQVIAIGDRRNGDGDVRLASGALVPLSRTYRDALALQLEATCR